jgi:phage terminase large subunit
LEGFNVAWVEEAHTLSASSLKMLRPTIRAKDSELWFSWNPRRKTDPVDLLFRAGDLPTGAVVVKSNWNDNPWFPAVLEQERQDDYRNLPRDEYDHVWEGGYSDTIPNAIILPAWFDACVDAHIKLGFKPLGQERVSYDPADSGDAKAVAHSHGSVILDARSTLEGRIDTATDWALTYAIDRKPDIFTWDADGMGMGLKRQITDAMTGKKIEIEAFRGSEAADNPESIYQRVDSEVKQPKTNKETFINKRTQYYWTLRDRMLRTFKAIDGGERVNNTDDLISFSSEIAELDALRSELCSIPRKYNSSGRIQLMTKQEMLKMDISSPNLADAVMMTQRAVQPRKKATAIRFEGWQ